MPVVSMLTTMDIVTLIPCNWTAQSLTTLQPACSHSYIRTRAGQWRFNCVPFGSTTLSPYLRLCLKEVSSISEFQIKKFVCISQNNNDGEEYGLIPKTTVTKFRTHDTPCV
jgi:hypothetical protein